MIGAEPSSTSWTAALRATAVRWWPWAAVPFGAIYLAFAAAHLGAVITNVNLDADVVSGPVIGQLFGSAPAHANVVLGTFGWYATLLFELATKWLPAHRQLWLAAPYAMALAGAAAAAWSVAAAAGWRAASLTLVLLICASPVVLHLELSMTQHAPVWFCLTILSAWLMALLGPQPVRRPRLMAGLGLIVGAVIGINAASDPLLTVSGLVPFAGALVLARLMFRTPASRRATALGMATLAAAGAFWGATLAVMSALSVSPEPGLSTTALALGPKVGSNVGLWLRSIAVLGNGDFFGHDLRFTSVLAVVCAGISIGAVMMLPRLGWAELRRAAGRWEPSPGGPARIALVVFWSASAVFLSAAFWVSNLPIDIHASRYLVGLVYAAAVVVPAVASRRIGTYAVALSGTCVVALAAVISMARASAAENSQGFPTPQLASQVSALAAREHAAAGYAGYWDAASITWSSRFRVRVFPVSICDRGQRLCRFDLHFISSWYEPRGRGRTFLLADRSLRLVPAPTPDLGRPSAVYQIGQLTMYVYPYDLATRIVIPQP